MSIINLRIRFFQSIINASILIEEFDFLNLLYLFSEFGPITDRNLFDYLYEYFRSLRGRQYAKEIVAIITLKALPNQAVRF